MTLNELFAAYDRRALVEGSTRLRCRSAWRHLEARLGSDFAADRVKPSHIDQLQRWLRDDHVTEKGGSLSDSTIVGYIAALSQVFAWASKNNTGIASNPIRQCDKIKQSKKLVRIFEQDEIEDLLDTVRGNKTKRIEPLKWVWWDKSGSLRWTATILTALTGPRLGEIHNLRWDDIDFEAAAIHIRTRCDMKGEYWRWMAKGRAERDVPMAPGQFEVLVQLREVAPHRYPFLKASRYEVLRQQIGHIPECQRKEPYITWAGEWARVLKATNKRREAEGRKSIKNRFHALRKTSATLYAEAGVPMHYVKRILGHSSSLLTEQVYVRLDTAKALAAGREALKAQGL